jgi:hypothetical protein
MLAFAFLILAYFCRTYSDEPESRAREGSSNWRAALGA